MRATLLPAALMHVSWLHVELEMYIASSEKQWGKLRRAFIYLFWSKKGGEAQLFGTLHPVVLKSIWPLCAGNIWRPISIVNRQP